jgi:hypothetical protein
MAERPRRNMNKYDPNQWHAVAYDDDGFVFNHHVTNYLAVKLEDENLDYQESDGELREISVVRGTAVPVPQSTLPEEEFYRGPGSYRTSDVIEIVEYADELPYEEVSEQWVRAQAMATALNAGGVL